MRIISGKFKGRRFDPPAKNWPTRPTTDYSKEGLYNILMNLIDFEESSFLDLFGGTGNHCYEFISRGCTDATYVDQWFPAIKFVREMVDKLQIEDEIKIVKSDVFDFIKRSKLQYDVIFAGPPYAMGNIDQIPNIILQKDMLKEDGMLIVEHNPNIDYENHPSLMQVRKYGGTIFSFFK